MTWTKPLPVDKIIETAEKAVQTEEFEIESTKKNTQTDTGTDCQDTVWADSMLPIDKLMCLTIDDTS